MNIKENRERWLAALESNKFKQGKNYLKYEIQNEVFYCCLGVALEIMDIPSKCRKLGEKVIHLFNDQSSTMTKEEASFFDLSEELEETLIKMNDIGFEFDEISLFLRERWNLPNGSTQK